MSDSLRPKLVAETDSSGRVTHVWLSMPDWKSARPVGQSDPVEGIIATSEFHGASKGEISDWLQRNWRR